MFRFYDRPEDWQATPAVGELCASLPGVFDVEKLKDQLATANDFLELSSMLRAWISWSSEITLGKNDDSEFDQPPAN